MSALSCAQPRRLSVFHLFWLLLVVALWCLPVHAFQYAINTQNKPTNVRGLNWSGRYSYAGPLHAARRTKKKPPSEENHGSNILCLKEEYGLSDGWLNKVQKNIVLSKIDAMEPPKLRERIEMIKKDLKLSKADIREMIQDQPCFLLVPPSTVFKAVQFLEEDLGLKKKQARTLIIRNANLLGCSIENLQRKAKWLQARLQLDDKEKMSRFFKQAPNSLGLRIEDNMEPTISKLQDRLGLDNDDIAKVFRKAPILIQMNFTTGIEPKLSWLEEFFALEEGDAAKFMMRHPQTIQYSMNETVKPNSLWLQERLALNQEELRKVFVNFPPIFWCKSNEKIEPMLQWLPKNLELQDVAQLRKIFVSLPILITRSIDENLEPTLDFFKDFLGHAEAVEFARRDPLNLLFGLESRLKPRLQQWEELQLDVDSNVLRKICKSSAEKWEKHLEYQSSKGR